MPVATPARFLAAGDAEEVHLVFPESVHRELVRVLFPSEESHPFSGKGERGAFCVVTRSTGVRRVSYLVRDVIHPVSSNDLDFVRDGAGDSRSWLSRRPDGGTSGASGIGADELGLRFSKEYHQWAIRRAKSLGGGLLRVHTHPGGVSPSSVDTRSAERVFGGDVDRLSPGAPLLAAITNDQGHWSVRAYEYGSDPEPVVSQASAVRIVGPRFRKIATKKSPQVARGFLSPIGGAPHDSTMQLWGEDGQRILAGLRVGLVGCGGVGSILASHLPRLGIGGLTLVDFDRLEDANANRAAGATRMDIRQRRLKTRVAQREAHRAATLSAFETTVVDGSVVEDDPAYAAVPDLLDCDVIIAAVDAARPRKVLDHLATVHCIPVLTGGSLLHVDEEGLLRPEAKIETSITGPDFPCFKCQRVWLGKDVEEEKEHPRFRGEARYIEGGVDPDERPRSPSVVGVNSIVAGLIQHRLTALTLGVAGRVVGTHRLKPRDLSVRWFSAGGYCQDDCGRPPVAAGDRHPLPLGTDLTMRYERDDIAMPEAVTVDQDRAAEILGGIDS